MATATISRSAAIWSISQAEIPVGGKDPILGNHAKMYNGHQSASHAQTHLAVPKTAMYVPDRGNKEQSANEPSAVYAEDLKAPIPWCCTTVQTKRKVNITLVASQNLGNIQIWNTAETVDPIMAGKSTARKGVNPSFQCHCRCACGNREQGLSA